MVHSLLVTTVVVITSALLPAIASGSTPEQCQYHVPSYAASFDLSPLALPPGSYYALRDQSTTGKHNFTYIFNMCEPVALGQSIEACDRDPELSVPAWQIVSDRSRCWALSNTSTTYQWALLDPDDPTLGVSVTYTGGDKCGSGPAAGTERSLTINVFCSNEPGLNELAAGRVSESQFGCSYELSVDSLFGCPTECSVTANGGRSFALCANHGICEYDTDLGRPKCFCNRGWSGADCATQTDSSDGASNSASDGIGGFGVLLILVLIILVGLNMAAVLLMCRLRAFKPQRELNQMDAEHLASMGTAPLPDHDDSTAVATAGSLNEPEPSLTRQVGGVSGVFTIE